MRTILLVLWGVTLDLCAQNLLPNPDFAAGETAPLGWRLTDGQGEWTRPDDPAHRVLQVRGNGADQSSWRTEPLPLEPGGLYSLRFRARRAPGASGGTAVSGPSRVNRDFRLSAAWEWCRFVFAMPNDVASDYVRLGQWHVNGAVDFGSAALVPVLAAHARTAELELGEGESIRQGRYRFQPSFNWLGANFHRPLEVNRAGFNSDRWLFAPGAQVVYRHRVGDLDQTNARVRAGINYYLAGTLQLAASRDGASWVVVGELGETNRSGVFDLPAELFPAAEMRIRLAQAGAGVGFQVDTYEYEAGLAQTPPDAEGATHLVEVQRSRPGLDVALAAVAAPRPDSAFGFECIVRQAAGRTLELRARASTETQPEASSPSIPITLPPGATVRVTLPVVLDEPGTHNVRLALTDGSDQTWFAGQAEVRASFLDDRRYGHMLRGTADLGLWWCESGWKVGRHRGLPVSNQADPKPVRVTAAQGEYEAAQVVLRPAREAKLLAADVSPFRGPGGAMAPVGVRLDEVAYVQVVHPTDATCLRGWYPDPLPPIETPL
ncbi:MAG: hypothetical protein FJ387_30180, partial [Verrucomicrobia bacterium]|nr:hypothetical protein [Verrucomicrobiota bacterium]